MQGSRDLCGCGFPGQLRAEGERLFSLAAVEDAVAITVRRDRDALGLRQGVQDLEVAVRVFFVPEGGRKDFSGGIVHGRNQCEARPALVEPGVSAAVKLDKEACLRHPLATAAVARWTAAPRAGPARRAQDAADGGARKRQAFALAQEFLQVVVIDADVDLGGEAHDAGPNAVRDAVDGRVPAIPMDESGRARGSQRRAEPPDLTHGPSEELGGLDHQQLAAVEGMEDFQDLFGAGRQGDHASPGSAQPGEDIFADLLGRTKSLTYHTT